MVGQYLYIIQSDKFQINPLIHYDWSKLNMLMSTTKYTFTKKDWESLVSYYYIYS